MCVLSMSHAHAPYPALFCVPVQSEYKAPCKPSAPSTASSSWGQGQASQAMNFRQALTHVLTVSDVAQDVIHQVRCCGTGLTGKGGCWCSVWVVRNRYFRERCVDVYVDHYVISFIR